MAILEHHSEAIALVDIQALCDKAEQQGELIYEQVGFESRFNLPQQLGQGGESEIRLRDGISLVIRDGVLSRSIKLENRFSASPPLISKFHLSGNSRVLTPNVSDIKDEYTEVSGSNYLYHLPNVVEFEEWYEEKIQLVIILLQPDRLQEFDPGCDCLPQPLHQLVVGDETPRFHQPLGDTTAVMKQVLHQILHCSYQGMMKQMYLEGKALELLSLQFAEWTAGLQQQKQQKQSLRSEDIERLHHAREILLQQVENPPSLLALARQVGIDDCKLKWGFRQLFGTTVFGYLHEHRMERSRQLLAMGQMNVTEVAYTVGYSSLPSFSKAFRKRFGSSPMSYATSHSHCAAAPMLDCSMPDCPTFN
jgi:AraC family transcriptional regulator, transcriptional activator of the genes for pyochelin and ferripyochelin receptors